MNLQSDLDNSRTAAQRSYVEGTSGVEAIHVFRPSERSVSPFEFRFLSGEEPEEMWNSVESHGGGQSGGFGKDRLTGGRMRHGTKSDDNASDRAAREAAIRSAVETARLEGVQEGEREGHHTARAGMESEMQALVVRERERVRTTVEQFCGARDRYFADVEQEIVRLALAIAARVMHREAQIDPLLLTGAVRVALEKMADHSGVVLRVAGAEVESWEQVFRATDASERPRVLEDARLERGECVLETQMATVELGVQVQLEEIEKGFFDLLSHRPVE